MLYFHDNNQKCASYFGNVVQLYLVFGSRPLSQIMRKENNNSFFFETMSKNVTRPYRRIMTAKTLNINFF